MLDFYHYVQVFLMLFGWESLVFIIVLYLKIFTLNLSNFSILEMKLQVFALHLRSLTLIAASIIGLILRFKKQFLKTGVYLVIYLNGKHYVQMYLVILIFLLLKYLQLKNHCLYLIRLL